MQLVAIHEHGDPYFLLILLKFSKHNNLLDQVAENLKIFVLFRWNPTYAAANNFIPGLWNSHQCSEGLGCVILSVVGRSIQTISHFVITNYFPSLQ